jgi:hypothetical protein
MIQLVLGLYKRCLHTRFGVSSFSHSQTRVFTSHTSVTDRNKVTACDLESRSRSCMIKLVLGLHKRCLHNRFEVPRFSHSQTRVFTRHKSVTDRNKMAASDLESRSRSCMSKLVQGLHKSNLCFEFEDCSLCRSRPRVFTSTGRTDGQ